MEYPKVLDNALAHQPELIWRDFAMHNLHIQHDKLQWLKDITDIMDAHRFEDDFCGTPCLCTEDGCGVWDINEMPRVSGLAAPICTDAVNGVLNLTTGGDDDDYGEMIQCCECWQLVNCYPLYAEGRFHLDDAIQSDFWFGLIQRTTWFGGCNNYVVVRQADGSDALIASTSLGGVVTNQATGCIMGSHTWGRIGIHWDGAGTIRWWVIQDGDYPQTVLCTGQITTTIPVTELALGFGVMAGEDAAKTLLVDYVKCAQKRVIG